MKEPLVSVCVLTYMHERYIEDCLKSLLAQTYQNIELMILDDASTDHTYYILKSYEERLRNRFVHVQIERNAHNSGNISANLNRMLKQARGEYIKTFSGDDAMVSKYVERIVGHMEKNREAILGYTNSYIVEDQFKLGEKAGNNYIYTGHRPCCQDKIFDRLLMDNYINAPTTMLRGNAFAEYGFFDENIKFEDYEFWLRLSRKESFTYLPEALIYYRRAECSISNYKSGIARRKIKFMITEEKKVRNKYMQGLSKGKKRKYWQCYLNQYLRRALEAHLWDVAIQLIVFIRKNKYEIDKEVFRVLF